MLHIPRALRVVFLTLAALLCSTYILLPGQASSDGQKPFLLKDTSAVKKVAVIGAGAAGASTAYFLKDFAEKHDVPVNITVYERNNYIGGRTTVVHAYDDPEEPVELGASIFVQVNKILYDAAIHFELPLVDYEGGSADGADQIGVWNGREFVVVISNGGWWETIKMAWRYGLSPLRLQNLVKKTVGQFLKMYDEPVFPWKSLTQTALDLELTAATSTAALDFLKLNSVYPPFTTDLIQASTRVNYASNLGHISGLVTMVAMSTDNAMAVGGGNWRIFDKMVQTSKAGVLLETGVTNVERKDGGKTWVVNAASSSGDELEDEYDEVVIATPYQFSNITSHSITPPETIKYTNLYVTLFTSPYRLSPKYFKLDKGLVPDMVLSTLPPDEDETTKGVGLTRFWSVNILRVLERKLENGVKRKEYLYKIFSPTYWEDDEILEMIGLPGDASALTWTHRKLWQSYPVEEPRTTFQEARLDFGLWYTAGLEAFISCMETMSLAGKNVAANIVEGWVSERRAAEMPKMPMERDQAL